MLVGAVVFSYGFLHTNVPGTPEVLKESARQLREFTEEYVHSSEKGVALKLEDLKKSRAAPELLDADQALPDLSRLTDQELKAIRALGRDCKSNVKLQGLSEIVKKQVVWEQFRCGAIKSLPANFFTTSPFMSLNGESFDSLQRQVEGGSLAATGDFPRAHLLEILNSNLFVEGGLGVRPNELKPLLAAPELYLATDWLWVLDQKQFGERYSLYRRSSFERYISKQAVQPHIHALGEDCAVVVGNLCWEYNSKLRERLLAVGTFFMLVGILMLFVILINQRRSDVNERTLMLKLLTHELRTPVTSIALWLETLRPEIEAMPEASRAPWNGMYDEVRKMKLLMEKSAWFIRLQSVATSQSAVELLPVNLLDWLGDYVKKNYPGVQLELGSEPAWVLADAYWLGILFKNLIENAFQHGKPPVRLALKVDRIGVQVVVQDEGQMTLVTSAGRKSPLKVDQSKGLGMGSSIVLKIAGMMHAKVEYQTRPTRVSLRFKKV